MKKWGVLSLLLVGLLTLAGCESVERALRGDDYVDQKIAASSSQAAEEKAQKELQIVTYPLFKYSLANSGEYV